MKEAQTFAFFLDDVVVSRSLNMVGRVVQRIQDADEGNSYRVRYFQPDGETFHVHYPESQLQLAEPAKVA